MQPPSPFEFDPYSVQVQEDPYPYYKVLRDKHPLYWCERARCGRRRATTTCGCLQRCNALLLGARQCSTMILRAWGTRWAPATRPSTTDSVVNAAFMRGRVLDREPRSALTGEFIDEFVARGEGDVITDLARISAAASRILGFERGRHVQIKH